MSTHSYTNTQYSNYGTTQYNAGYSAGRASAGGGSSGGSTSNTLTTSWGKAKLSTAATYTVPSLRGIGASNNYVIFTGTSATASNLLGKFRYCNINSDADYVIDYYATSTSQSIVTISRSQASSTYFTLCELQ